MRVFRVEHKATGLGPYRNETGETIFDYELYWEDDSIMERQPSPKVDGFSLLDLEDDIDFLFGFKTLCQLMNWFNKEELQFLIKLGYQVKVYEGVELLGESDKQLIFTRG